MKPLGMGAAAAAMLAATSGFLGASAGSSAQQVQRAEAMGNAWRYRTRRMFPRKTPDWTNARYRRAAAKKRAVKRNRRAHR